MSNHPISFQLNCEMIQLWKAMKQQNRSAIARASHTASDIVTLMKLPKATVYRVFKRFKEESKVDWIKSTWIEVILSAVPRFLLASNAWLKPTHPHLWELLQRNESLSTVSTAVNRDFGITSYVQRCRHQLTAKTKAIKASVIQQTSSHRKSSCVSEREKVHCGSWGESQKFSCYCNRLFWRLSCVSEFCISNDIRCRHEWRKCNESTFHYNWFEDLYRGVSGYLEDFCYSVWSRTFGLTIWCWSRIP